MATPQSYIAFAPFGVGLMAALVYIERGDDVYGWWIGARDCEYHSSFFKLENFFTTKPTRFYATEGMDLYRGWTTLYSARKSALDKAIPIDDEVSHELDRLQDMFVAEWLFFEDDADAEAERDAYDKMDFPLRHVNIRSTRLDKLGKSEAVWIYRSHGFDRDVIDYLERYWPLDYGAVQTEKAHG